MGIKKKNVFKSEIIAMKEVATFGLNIYSHNLLNFMVCKMKQDAGY